MERFRLIKEFGFVGKVFFEDTCINAIVNINQDLGMEVFFSDFTVFSERRIPPRIEGEIAGWTVLAQRCLRITHGGYKDFKALLEELTLSTDQTEHISASDRAKPWWHITIRMESVDFTKIDFKDHAPDEWGVNFYPDEANRALFGLLHEGSRDCRELPRIFADVDSSSYFKNRKVWSVAAMLDRIRLITSALTIFAGSPLSYTSLIGRCAGEVAFVRANWISNPNSFVCPGNYNGHVYINDSALDEFKTTFTSIIDRAHNDPDRVKIGIIFSYFEELYTALHEETRLAFSFQLMEAIAHYKGINFNNSLRNDIKQKLFKKFSKELCPTCLALLSSELQPETDAFDMYLGQAVDAIGTDDNFRLNPVLVKDLAKRCRNEVFHGNFFEDMTEIDNIVNTLPEGYKRDLAVILQAVVSILGAHFLLGLDFSSLTTLKRKMQSIALGPSRS